MSPAPIDRAARHVAFPFFALAALGMGLVILVDGEDGVALPIYVRVTLLPWQGWATWALVAGLLMSLGMLLEVRSTRWAHPVFVTALAGLVAWWALRWALLTAGSVETGPPHAGIVSYGLIVALHAMALVLEVWPTIDCLLDRLKAWWQAHG